MFYENQMWIKKYKNNKNVKIITFCVSQWLHTSEKEVSNTNTELHMQKWTRGKRDERRKKKFNFKGDLIFDILINPS